MVNPVPGYSVSSAYHKTGSHWTTCGWHTGQDYSAPEGTIIVAARGGTVEYVNYGSAFGGHQFAIRPGDGTEDFYAHCRTRTMSGITVLAGEPVGTVGNEGNSTGPHLHLERHKSYGWGCSLMDDPMKSHNQNAAPQEDDMTPEQAESLAECRRMLGVLMGHQSPATTGEARLLEDTGEARRMLGVVLAAREPAPGEQSIPEQLGGESY